MKGGVDSHATSAVAKNLWPADPDAMSWKPFLPAGTSGKKAKPRQVNTATIARLSRKLIASEWAAAFGRKKDPYADELAQMKRWSAEYKQEKERKKKLKAQARRRAARLIDSLQESLTAFARRLREMSPDERADSAEELLEELLRSVGNVDHIHWMQSGCEITFEPWEERRLRRRNRTSLPVLFVVKVDDQLCLTDCVQLDGKHYEASRRESILDRIHAAMQQHGRTPEVLQDTFGEVGRIVDRINMKDGSIKVNIESWEEVRRRRIEGGRSPVKTYMVSADATLENIRVF